jgi:LCP family protein required for cell wall assembly
MSDSTTQEMPKGPDISAKKVFPLILLAFLAGILIFIGLMVQNTVGLKNTYILASNFITAPVENVVSDNGRTNILIMGKAGGEHEGTDLTDTMILASVQLGKPTISLTSIPRDLWIPEIRAKVNSAYYWGNQRSEGGIPFAKSTVEKVVGVPIQYGLVIDFSAFKDIVDAIGGIEVNVERPFTDQRYPIEGRENDLCDGDPLFACRYETLSFDAGAQKMDGDTALKFVRSRMAEGDEGTDQAREARQQKVIGAIKSKVMSPKVFLNPRRVIAVFDIVQNSVETDINIQTAAVLARKAVDAGESIKQYLIPDALLVNPPINKTYDSQYVFIPKAGNGNWKDVHAWVLESPLSPGK